MTVVVIIILSVPVFNSFAVNIFFFSIFSNWMILVALLGTLVVLFPLMIKRHETPTNYILLGAFVSGPRPCNVLIPAELQIAHFFGYKTEFLSFQNNPINLDPS